MFKLPDIESEGAFDRAKGLTTLLVRAKIRRNMGDEEDEDDDDGDDSPVADVNDDGSVNEDDL